MVKEDEIDPGIMGDDAGADGGGVWQSRKRI